MCLRHANRYNPHFDRHILSASRINAVRDGVAAVETNFLVVQTTKTGESRLFCAGCYEDRIRVGGAKADGGMVAFTPDGKRALVSRSLDNKVSLLAIDGAKVEYTKRDMTPGVRPIVLDVAASGAFAVVGSLAGAASGDHDSISLIDLAAKPPRVVDTIGVRGSTAEGFKISPDSSVVAVVVHNGSNRPKSSPFHNPAGKLVMVRVADGAFARVAEAPIGRWPQGVAFAPDGKTLLVGNMIEKDYWVFQ